MCKQSIKRWVWTITTFPELSNFPGFKKPEVSKIENLYFRLETQTSVPLDSETSLFFIKVEVIPLLTIWNVRILDSINSMTENVLNYKDLMQIKKLLNKIPMKKVYIAGPLFKGHSRSYLEKFLSIYLKIHLKHFYHTVTLDLLKVSSP